MLFCRLRRCPRCYSNLELILYVVRWNTQCTRMLPKVLPTRLLHPCSACLHRTKIVKREFAISLGYLARPCLSQLNLIKEQNPWSRGRVSHPCISALGRLSRKIALRLSSSWTAQGVSSWDTQRSCVTKWNTQTTLFLYYLYHEGLFHLKARILDCLPPFLRS